MRNLSPVIIGIVSTLILLGGPAQGEYYRFTDENGVLHFTDNLNDVPVQQRKNISKYKGVAEKKTNIHLIPMDNPKPKKQNPKQSSAPLSVQEEIRELNIEKLALDKEYEQLVSRKQSLIIEKNKVRTTNEILIFQKKITALNMEISAYEQRRAAFEEKRKKVDLKAFKVKVPAEQ